jgi:fused signal recognition particle receptor
MPEFFSKWKEGLSKTRKSAFGRIAVLLGTSEISDATWEDLEGILIQADLGAETTMQIIHELRKETTQMGLTRAFDLQDLLKKSLLSRLQSPPAKPLPDNQPTVLLLVGVNGSGKTTTAAKLASQFEKSGKKVLLAAADTFRAAAVEQLQVWGERLNIPVIAGQVNADPGAVTYDAVQAAIARHTDILIVDTAGRLHTRINLMEELKKVYRVCNKAFPGAPHAVWLVLDATTGQNALIQATSFKEAVHIDGVVLAKLDSSAKGGMVFAIAKQLEIPVLYVGLGEKAEDLQVFDPNLFVESILSKSGDLI